MPSRFEKKEYAGAGLIFITLVESALGIGGAETARADAAAVREAFQPVDTNHTLVVDMPGDNPDFVIPEDTETTVNSERENRVLARGYMFDYIFIDAETGELIRDEELSQVREGHHTSTVYRVLTAQERAEAFELYRRHYPNAQIEMISELYGFEVINLDSPANPGEGTLVPMSEANNGEPLEVAMAMPGDPPEAPEPEEGENGGEGSGGDNSQLPGGEQEGDNQGGGERDPNEPLTVAMLIVESGATSESDAVWLAATAQDLNVLSRYLFENQRLLNLPIEDPADLAPYIRITEVEGRRFAIFDDGTTGPIILLLNASWTEIRQVDTLGDLDESLGRNPVVEAAALSREAVLALDADFQEAFDALPPNVMVYQDGILQLLSLFPETFNVVDGELRFTQNGREFIWTAETGWLIEQFTTPGDVGFFLSDDFKDMESRHEAGLNGTLYDGGSTFPRAIVPLDGNFDMTTYSECSEFDAQGWANVYGVVDNHEASSQPGIDAVDAAISYNWYRIYTEQNSITDLSYDDFVSGIESGEIKFSVTVNGQEVEISSATEINFRFSPNAAPGTSSEITATVDSQGGIQVNVEAYTLATFYVHGSIADFLDDLYDENVPNRSENSYDYQLEMQQALLPVNGAYRQIPVMFVDENNQPVLRTSIN